MIIYHYNLSCLGDDCHPMVNPVDSAGGVTRLPRAQVDPPHPGVDEDP